MTTSDAVRSKATIRLLGRFEVLVDGAPIDDSAWRGRKAQQLVKLLAVASGRTAHREQIADALWPDLDADGADRQLHKAIHAARRALEPELASGTDSAWIITQDRTVALSPDVAIDADDAESVAEAALASRDVEACRAALELFCGKLLPGDLYDTWFEARRIRVALLEARLLAAVAEGSVSAGRMAQAADAANRLLAIDVADERAHRVLMRVAAFAGNRTAVVRQFRACESALQSELGVEPSDATRSLFEVLVERQTGGEAVSLIPGTDSDAVLTVAENSAEAAGTSFQHNMLEPQFTAASAAGREGWRPGRAAGVVAAIAMLVCAAILIAVPQSRALIWPAGPSRPAVEAISGRLPAAFVRVSVPSSESSWSALTDASGRFVIRDAGIRAGDAVTLVVEDGGADRRAVTVAVPTGDGSGAADLGDVDLASATPLEPDARLDAGRIIQIDRANLDWYRGVAAAVTSGLATDHDRVTALHAFTSRRYARPSNNGPTDTPRRTIEVGTLFSGPIPIALATLTAAAGYPTRLVAVSAPRPVDIEHTVVEVFYDGRWHLFDPAFGLAAVNDLGEIANHEDLVRHPSLIDRMPYADVARPGWRGAEIPALLRSGVHRVTVVACANR